MSWNFEWDRSKGRFNRLKHRVGFEEATTAFGDPLALVMDDTIHSWGEARYILLGRSAAGRLLVVVHVDHGTAIRIISARLASPREHRAYEQGP